MSERVKITIDGKEAWVEPETTILEAARTLGIDVPTLCHNPALEPYGACRMCTVEIVGKGWSQLVTSCNYPIRREMEVLTASDRVVRGRRMLVELLLARCPDAPLFQEMAARYGVGRPRFETQQADLCYLCGLCVRVCHERVGAKAISFVGRGVEREVATPFFKISEACIACGACEFICPTGAIKVSDITDKPIRPLPLEFDMGLRGRGNIYIPFPQAVPNVPVIDRAHCLYFQAGTCRTCEEFCPPHAIDYSQEDEFLDVDVGAVVVATGFDPFDARDKPEFGYGRYRTVISGLEFERLASASGPTQGKIKIDGKVPQDIVFVHCVGSRDKQQGGEYCSRICCMYTAKQAHLAHDKIPGSNITVFYMDVRAFGKGFEEFYDRVRAEGITYRRGNPSEIYRRGDRLVVRAEDTLLGRTVEVEADLVVLATGVQPRADAAEVASMLSLERGEDGFFQELHPELRPVDTKRRGIFLAGTVQSPKDIPDTVAQAKAAAAGVIVELSKLRRKAE
ncbi:MAG TPA: 2Fe-2S iron-sulfur cluster-binding protein [Anaerolineae bacterium]|nr:2Fe-2S iron-sulfur cluster-binding protein [Anaerolineae bacterium]